MTNNNHDEETLRRVANKVRALMALADNNPNEHEAQSAAAKAQELLTAYNLELAQSGEESARLQRTFKGGLYKWQRHLWEEVSRLHFCMYWCKEGLMRGSKYEHVVLGREVNVVSVKILVEYLEDTINRLVRERYGSHPIQYFSKRANAYREGLSDRLCQRMREQRRKDKVENERKRREQEARKGHPGAATENALVVSLTDYEQEEHYLNLDKRYGLAPGTTMQRERERQEAMRKSLEEAKRRQKAEKEAEELLRQTDPEKWEAIQKEREKRYKEWEARERRNARRRKGISGSRIKEKPADYYVGFDHGKDVSLSKQASDQSAKKIEGK